METNIPCFTKMDFIEAIYSIAIDEEMTIRVIWLEHVKRCEYGSSGKCVLFSDDWFVFLHGN